MRGGSWGLAGVCGRSSVGLETDHRAGDGWEGLSWTQERVAGGHVVLSGPRQAEVGVSGWTGQCTCVHVCAHVCV